MDETESVAAAVNGAEACYTGVVPAGTPVCDESEQILLGDRFGLQTGVMKAFATVWDGQPADASEHQLQTVGYLYTPQPLSAGTYVLCEIKSTGQVMPGQNQWALRFIRIRLSIIRMENGTAGCSAFMRCA